VGGGATLPAGISVAGGASCAQGGTGSMRVASSLAGDCGAGGSIKVGGTTGSRGVGGGVISPVV